MGGRGGRGGLLQLLRFSLVWGVLFAHPPAIRSSFRDLLGAQSTALGGLGRRGCLWKGAAPRDVVPRAKVDALGKLHTARVRQPGFLSE